jgi:hypothetical protein
MTAIHRTPEAHARWLAELNADVKFAPGATSASPIDAADALYGHLRGNREGRDHRGLPTQPKGTK